MIDSTPSGEFFSIRVLIKHPTWPADEISSRLSTQPIYSWSVGEPKRKETMWSIVSWTEGKRLFFEEVRQVLDWLKGNGSFVSDAVGSGGTIEVIAQLPGRINLGSTLDRETMALAASLCISVGVEVFPDMRLPN